MSFRLDMRGTIILTVLLLGSSYVIGMFLTGTTYCMVIAVVWIAIMAAGNWGWIKHQLTNKGGGDDRYR